MVTKSESSLIRSIIDVIGFLLISAGIIIQSIVRFFLPKNKDRIYKSIKGEVVLITGGGGGLGRLLAVKLSKLEATIVLWDVNKKAVDETVDLVKASGGSAYGFKCDLVDKEDVYKMANITKQEVGDVTILINNAGVVSGNYLLETPDELIKRTFDVNILAHFWTTKAFLPEMMGKNHGHIVTIASMAGQVGIPKLVDYCSSKYAAVGFDEALRVELDSQGVKGVKTTVICPYFIQSTGMFDNVKSRFLPTLKSSDVADRIVAGLRKNDLIVLIPGIFWFGLIFKWLVPWACISMFLRGLIQDAVPVHPPVNNVVQEKPIFGNNSLKNKLTALNKDNGIVGKNL